MSGFQDINIQPFIQKYKLINFLLIFSCCAIVIWQLTDSVLFGINFYTDGNGIELESW